MLRARVARCVEVTSAAEVRFRRETARDTRSAALSLCTPICRASIVARGDASKAGPGAVVGVPVGTRKMTSGISRLKLHPVFARQLQHGVGNTIGTNTVSGTYAIGQPNLRVYGSIPSGQALPSGTYTDIITVAVTY